MTRQRLLLPVSLGIAILAVSTASILIRLAQEHAPSLTIAAMRLLIATAILAPLALFRHRAELRSMGARHILLAAASGAFLAVHFATWISSLEFTSVASSVVLVSTGPLWVAMLSPIILRERLARAAIAGLVLSLVGGMIISADEVCSWASGLRCGALEGASGSRALWGNFLALAGAWAVSGYLMLGRHLRASLSLIPYIFLVYGFAAIGLLATAVLTGGLRLSLPISTYSWIVLLAVVPQLVGHSTYNWALRYLPAALVAITTLGEPLGSAALAYMILGETPGTLVLAGGAFILGGIYVASRGTSQTVEVGPRPDGG